MGIDVRQCAIVVLLSAGAALGGCKRSGATAGGAGGPPPMPTVTVSHPIERNVTVWDEYTGRLQAVDFVNVYARVSGYIETAPFQEGALVKEGDVLFTIDVRPFQAQLDNALGNVTQAEAKLQLAKDDLARGEQAAKTGVISPEELDTRKQDVNQAQGALTTAKADAEAARLNVEWCTVRAPITGRISRKYVTPGNLIVGGAGAGASPTLLTTIASVDPIYCYIDVDEGAVLKYQRQIREHKRVSARQAKIPVSMALTGEEEFTHQGHIDFVNNQVDPATGTLQVRAVFPNPDGFLTPGMFARIRVAGEQLENALLVTDDAILTNQNERYVLTVDNTGTVQYRAVTPGPAYEGYRVVRSGLTAEDWVVVKGLMTAQPEMKVKAEQAPMPTGQIVAAGSGGVVTTEPARESATTEATASEPVTQGSRR